MENMLKTLLIINSQLLPSVYLNEQFVVKL